MPAISIRANYLIRARRLKLDGGFMQLFNNMRNSKTICTIIETVLNCWTVNIPPEITFFVAMFQLTNSAHERIINKTITKAGLEMLHISSFYMHSFTGCEVDGTLEVRYIAKPHATAYKTVVRLSCLLLILPILYVSFCNYFKREVAT